MKYIIGLVVVAVVVGFVAMQTLLGPATHDSDSATNAGDTEMKDGDNAAGSEAQAQTFTGTDTLEKLLTLGSPVECTITVVDEEGSSSATGTFFGADGRMRGDFLQAESGMDQPVLASMIMVDNMMYSWSEIDGEQYGVKIDLSQFPDTTETQYDQGPVSADQPVEYDCKRWMNVDNSVFEPPADVLFQDMGALMQAGMEYGTVYTEGEF